MRSLPPAWATHLAILEHSLHRWGPRGPSADPHSAQSRLPLGQQDAWVAQGLDLELDDVLTTSTLPRQTPPPEGYTVRRLRGQDWAQSVARSVADNVRTDEQDPTSFERFSSEPGLATNARADPNISHQSSIPSETPTQFGPPPRSR